MPWSYIRSPQAVDKPHATADNIQLMADKHKMAAPLWLLAAAAAVAAIVAALWFTKANGPTRVADPTTLIGGPFSLIDQTGKRVTEADFRGRYMLVFFGYTFCPDVCPVELQSMSAALDMLDQKTAAKVTPVFITIDPARDTVAVMAAYVKAFHPRLIGLTGTAEEIAAAARAYRIYYQKAAAEAADDDSYLMDHSAIVYLMGPDGKYVAHFSPGTKPEAMAARLKDLL